MMTEGYYKVDGKAKNLLEENWDFLIILDACRYDFFEDVYRNYLDGNVKKAISPALHTMDWLNKVFPDFYDDIVYISANPYINSKIEVTDHYGFKFDGKKHFFRIVDVWKWGWESKLGTVPPGEVNKAVVKVKDNYRNKRFIVHYIQPHEPYISKNYIHYIPENYAEKRGKIDRIIDGEKEKGNINVRASIGKAIQKIFGIEGRWKISNLLGVYPLSQSDSIGYNEGIKGLRRAYKENLEVVLESVAELLKHVSGTILITADHGEYLGENGRYGHGLVPRRPPIVEVPWLIIEKKESKQREVSDKELIKERIKRLRRTGKI